jgi:DNA mismatch repair protein MutS
VVFDVGSGELRTEGSESGAGVGAESAESGEGERESEDDPLDPATEAVLEELRDADPERTAPLELAERVREWQDRLEE